MRKMWKLNFEFDGRNGSIKDQEFSKNQTWDKHVCTEWNNIEMK